MVTMPLENRSSTPPFETGAAGSTDAVRARTHPSSDADGEAVPAALDWLAQRHSVGPRHLGAPAPDDAALAQAARLSTRAPDHLLLRPCRFVRVPDARREALAAMFERDAQERGLNEAECRRAHARAFNGPALLAVIARIEPGHEDAPPHEQWVSVGGALMNFLNGLHLQGFAAKVLSGSSVRNTEIRCAFCDPDEELVAWIVAGTATRAPQERVQAEPRRRPVLQDWVQSACAPDGTTRRVLSAMASPARGP
jgi:nitroreductase